MRALEPSLSRPKPLAFWEGQEAENEFKVTSEPLKHPFLDLTKYAFSAGQEDENEFQVLRDPFKHPFSTSTISHFGLVKRKKTSSECLETT